MKKSKTIVERYADNGEFSHLVVVDNETGEELMDQSLQIKMEDRIKIIKTIRAKENHFHDQAKFCREHNFMLEAARFQSIEDELRRVCSLLQEELDTPYVSYS